MFVAKTMSLDLFSVASAIITIAFLVILILFCRWFYRRMKMTTDVKQKKMYLFGCIMMVAFILIWLVQTIIFQLPVYLGYVFIPLHYMIVAIVLIFALAFASYFIIKRYYIDND